MPTSLQPLDESGSSRRGSQVRRVSMRSMTGSRALFEPAEEAVAERDRDEQGCGLPAPVLARCFAAERAMNAGPSLNAASRSFPA